MGIGAHRFLALAIGVVAGALCFPGTAGPDGTATMRGSDVCLEKNSSSSSLQTERETAIFEVTAYTANDPGMDGRGITSTGVKAKEWRTVAADPEVLPPGTVVYIPHFTGAPNGGKFVVEDTGSAIRGRRLDVYMASRGEALEFGRRKLRVEILRRGETRSAGEEGDAGRRGP